jgi:hypothetical protein
MAMPSLQEMSDYWDIKQLMIDYSTAVDTHNFDGLDTVFTPDAHIDYSTFGGIDGKYPEVKQYLIDAMPAFPNYYHMIGNADIRLHGDTATSRTICFNPMEITLADGTSQIMFCGLWYVDKHVRTPDGWRIAERVEEACYTYNVPGGSIEAIAAPKS